MRFAVTVLWAWLTQLYHISDGEFITEFVPIGSLGSCVVNGTAVDYGRDFALEWPCEEWNCSGAINETHAMLRRKTCRKPDPPNRYCRIKKDRGRFSRCCPRRVCHLEGWPDEEYE
ncbi:uncharacterized protein LOC125945518 isoform X1 [Dermacentor silvarum]|uniref:uncharacterized protein LOC125945518 isoform X1 n=1 Tax=Dermacentor silvarum TaxID=543639 RepID=UPI002100BBDC|nr:uncharacterized protein LOC125945518 isoform X1 [Dermacentor silvarum]